MQTTDYTDLENTDYPVVSAEDLPQQYEVEIASILAACKTDLNMLAAICMPHMFKFLFPKVFLALWQWIRPHFYEERAFPRLAVGLPRGFAKTVVIKLLILYALFYTRKKYIVVFCATLDKAEGVIADICQILSNENVSTIFGDWSMKCVKDRADLKKFWFRGRYVVLRAAGVGTDIRGTNLFEARPDFQVFDDVQKREDAESTVKYEHLKTWFFETAMKTRDPFGCVYVFLGNLYPTEYSLLRELDSNPHWLKFITGCILDSGESLWEDLMPLELLLKEYDFDVSSGRLASFMAEMMNDRTIRTAGGLDISKVPQCTFENEVLHQGNFLIVDPSTGKTGKDPVAIGYAEVYDGVPVLRKLFVGAFSPKETIQRSIQVAIEHNCRFIFVEGVAYQETLVFWFREVCQAAGIEGLIFEPVYPGKHSKNSRIVDDMFPALLRGEIQLHSSVRNTVLLEASLFRADKKDNRDDILDVCSYIQVIHAKYGGVIASAAMMVIQSTPPVEMLPAHRTCSF